MNNIDPQAASLPESGAMSSLLSAAGLSVERLPMLQVLFERVCTGLVQQFENLSDAEIELTLERVWTGEIDEANVEDDRNIVVELGMSDEGASSFFVLDRPALYLLLECFLGASGNERPYTQEHDFTALELMFAKTIADRAGLAFRQVFSDFIDVTMFTKTAKKGCEIKTLSVPKSPFLIGSFALDVFDRSGLVNILIPQIIIAPLKNRFVSVENSEGATSDAPWVEHIKSQLLHTDMECQAILDGGQVTLENVASMKVGDIFELDIPADSQVRLSSNKQNLFWCELGQTGGSFTLKIADPAPEKKDFLDVMLEGRDLTGSGDN